MPLPARSIASNPLHRSLKSLARHNGLSRPRGGQVQPDACLMYSAPDLIVTDYCAKAWRGDDPLVGNAMPSDGD